VAESGLEPLEFLLFANDRLVVRRFDVLFDDDDAIVCGLVLVVVDAENDGSFAPDSNSVG